MTRPAFLSAISVALLLGLATLASAQVGAAEKPSPEYVITAQLLYADGAPAAPLLTATGRFGAKPQDAAQISAEGGARAAGKDLAAGMALNVLQLEHDAWGHLVVEAHGSAWIGTVDDVAWPGDPPKPKVIREPHKSLELNGTGTYPLRPDVPTEVLNLSQTTAGGVKRELRLVITAKAL